MERWRGGGGGEGGGGGGGAAKIKSGEVALQLIYK
jgi:hypothetical protein